jgi:hypothetical protein
MSIRTPLLSLAAAALASTALAGPASAAQPVVKVHAIFGGTGVHVGQVLDVRVGGRKAKQVCWDPAPIDRPACSASVNGAPSATGTTRLTLTLADGTELHKTLRVAPAYARRGGHGGSDASPGHTCSKGLALYGNVPPKGSRKGTPPRDFVTNLAPGARVAEYNRIGQYVFFWEYRTNKAGFGGIGCVRPGLGS